MKKSDKKGAPPSRTGGEEPRRSESKKAPRPNKRSSIVSPRDERGTPYRGDFPNPLRGITRDCF